MHEEIESPGPKIEIDDVVKLELEFNLNLPEDYKEFLLKFNGGLPWLDEYVVDGFYEEYCGIQVLYGIGREIQSSCLDYNIKAYRERINNDLIPIGCSGTNDAICLAIKGNSYGSVYFWDLVKECGKDCPDNLYVISDSFAGFLRKLTKFDD